MYIQNLLHFQNLDFQNWYVLSKSVRTVVVPSPHFQNRACDEKSEEKACSRRFLIVLLQPNQIPSWFSKRDPISSVPIPLPGEMPEWSNGPHSKCGERATVPGVRIPLSPPYKGCKFLIYILFSFSHLSPKKQRHPRQRSRVSLRLLRIFPSFRQLLHHLVKITFQPFHLSPAINHKFPLSFFDGCFVRNTSFAFEELTL